GLAWSKDGARIVAGSDRQLVAFDLQSRKEIFRTEPSGRDGKVARFFEVAGAFLVKKPGSLALLDAFDGNVRGGYAGPADEEAFRIRRIEAATSPMRIALSADARLVAFTGEITGYDKERTPREHWDQRAWADHLFLLKADTGELLVDFRLL